MKRLRALLLRVAGLFGGAQRERELADELDSHLQMHIDDNVRAGMTAEQARRDAMLRLGGVETTKQAYRERSTLPFFETLVQDVRYSLRGFGRNPVFTLTIVVTLMLGIGATTAVFSVVDRILFRAPPYAHADRLVSVGLVAPIEPDEFMLGGSYYDWRDNQTPFEAFTSETGVGPCDLTDERPARLSCAGVEANFLPTLGVTPLLGRNFKAEEDRPNMPRVMLISYGVWKSRYGLDPGIVNQLISIDGKPVRVIGVLPRDFEMPRLQAMDVMFPQALDENAQRKADPGRPMWAFARLKPGVTIEQAKAALLPEFDYSLRLAPPLFRKEVHLQVRSLRDRQMQDVRLAAWVLFGAVIAVLLIACANVASLLTARGAARERELAVRSALGASRGRLVRQALTESIMLSLIGAAAGCALAELLLQVFIAIAPEGIPFLNKAQLDARLIFFTILLSLVCGVLFGLAPALQRPSAQVLGGRSSLGISHAVLRQWLVVTQIAVSMVLLAGGVLLFRSFWNLQHQQLGMNTESVITAKMSLGQKNYPTPVSVVAFFSQLERNLRYGPGVDRLAMSDSMPPGGYHHDQIYASIVVAGRPKSESGTGGLITWRWVTPDYFRILDIPMLQGEGFREGERSSKDHFVVLSRSLADRMFPGQAPMGQRVQLAGGGPNDIWYTVTGVAANVKNGGLAEDSEPEYYRLRRNVGEDWSDTGSAILVKSTLPADVMDRWIRSQVAMLDPTLPVDIATLQQRVSKLADGPRFQTTLVGFFAAIGLVLAVIGLYGVIAFLVAQRTQEIGVRMALGAARGDILRLVMGRSLRLVLCGTVAGLVGALAVSRVLASLLFGVGSRDPVTFVAVTLLLIVVALLATLVPARRAASVNPVEALRAE
jgi:putative ABC transport system permease protein